jgi:uncharacterized protein
MNGSHYAMVAANAVCTSWKTKTPATCFTREWHAYLDHDRCQCKNYAHRQMLVPGCVVLTPDSVKETYWLPDTCAYRLIAEGLPLFDWHPLVSGDPQSVHNAGMSVAGRVVAESAVAEDDLEDYVIRWV